MIKSLWIKNFAIIKDLEIDFHPGLNIFTGETGAGKSVIVESIDFLFGAKIHLDVSLPVEVGAVIKEPSISEKEFVVKRFFYPDGRSKYFFNNEQINQTKIREISSSIIDFHSQMENYLINHTSKQIEIIDSYSSNITNVKKFQKLYFQLKDIEAKINNLNMNNSQRYRLIELYNYQLNEIENANLKENEDIEIEDKILKYKNTERLKKYIYQLKEYMNGENGMMVHIGKTRKIIDELIKIESSFDCCEIINRIEADLKIIYDMISNYSIDESFNIDDLISRDELIKKLKKKYGSTISDIKKFALDIKGKIEELSTMNYSLEELLKEKEKILKEMDSLVAEISNKREKFSVKFSKEVESNLKKLGFSSPKFSIFIEREQDFNQYGKDRIEFLFSANLDLPLKPLRYVASGGEISRIMLAIKSVINKYDDSKILVFDEIDAGIGGNTAFVVGEMVKSLSKNKQILCITHTPQLAIYADRHFLVEKKFNDGKTVVDLKTLDGKDRISEISRMLGSKYSNDSAKKHAINLLNSVSKKLKI